MRVLFAAPEWDYGIPAQGHSYEYTNMYDALSNMEGIEVALFDFLAVWQEGGSPALGRELLAAVDDFKPDLLFCVLYRDEFPLDVLQELRDRPKPLTFNWFCDDHWRFDNFTSHWAPAFNAVSTTSTDALPKYERLGYSNVIKTQWACNPHLYRPTPQPEQFDVTFVGQPHGNRRDIIDRLRKEGVSVSTWGRGWPEGRLEQDEMIRVFGQSRINLNLSNASQRPRSGWRPWKRTTALDQIKGRNFEIPACGGFQLSGDSEDLDSCFTPDEEIVIYKDAAELPDLVGRYLVDDAARRRIAEAGYRRTLAEHTFDRRFRQIFSVLPWGT